MNRAEFVKLPYLLTPSQAAAFGFASHTLLKLADNGVLRIVRPKGCTHRRYQKVQFALILQWMDAIDRAAWAREKPLLPIAAVCQWTGYHRHQIAAIVAAGGLTCVQPGGLARARYRKADIAQWIGL